MTVEIRPATMADYEAVCGLLNQLDGQHRAAHPEQFRAAEPVREKAFFEAWLEDADKQVWVVEDQAAIAGTVWFMVRKTPDMPILVPRTFLQIDALVVDDGQRGKGIGQALMAAVDAWARGRGIRELELGVWAFNESAIRFYQRLGYAIVYHKMQRRLD